MVFGLSNLLDHLIRLVGWLVRGLLLVKNGFILVFNLLLLILMVIGLLCLLLIFVLVNLLILNLGIVDEFVVRIGLGLLKILDRLIRFRIYLFKIRLGVLLLFLLLSRLFGRNLLFLLILMFVVGNLNGLVIDRLLLLLFLFVVYVNSGLVMLVIIFGLFLLLVFLLFRTFRIVFDLSF